MTIRKLDDGKPLPWLADIRPGGRNGPRRRKRFATKGEAAAWELWQLEQFAEKPWLGDDEQAAEPVADTRRLSDLVERWYGLHGQSLRDGEQRRSKLLLICESLGNPLAAEFTGNDFAKYREARLSGVVSDRRAATQEGKGVSASTVNRDHAYLRAVFNELKRLGEWTAENPLAGMRLYRVTESELAFLYPDEIKALLDACDTASNPDLGIVVRLCLATGARWGEIQDLTQSQVSQNRLTFTHTKGGKRRTVPINQELIDIIPKRRGKLFSECYHHFESAINKAGIQLPAGQSTHVLRHTFASHFMMNGGNILVLQKILGHSTITMTMRYAHFAPDHLEDALRLNPLTVNNLR
ncbi:tyrosine-type recombinase/integrase [Aeromonas dhakensis]|uniref:phage integrase n=1 Tax=Aeromonas TaxID=642 RepID=UPI000D767B57|nr:tyrosine-type recombinase/integrase [Aeromonas dhakensis]UCM51867.1 tyrosine-type recombinase/integrase [Aeromonas dhakensis]